MFDILLLAGTLFAIQDDVSSAAAVPLPDARRECRVLAETGSRLSRRRICATRAEWIERDRLSRQRLSEAQSRQVAPTYDDLLRNSPGRPSIPRCGRC